MELQGRHASCWSILCGVCIAVLLVQLHGRLPFIRICGSVSGRRFCSQRTLSLPSSQSANHTHVINFKKVSTVKGGSRSPCDSVVTSNQQWLAFSMSTWAVQTTGGPWFLCSSLRRSCWYLRAVGTYHSVSLPCCGAGELAVLTLIQRYSELLWRNVFIITNLLTWSGGNVQLMVKTLLEPPD